MSFSIVNTQTWLCSLFFRYHCCAWHYRWLSHWSLGEGSWSHESPCMPRGNRSSSEQQLLVGCLFVCLWRPVFRITGLSSSDYHFFFFFFDNRSIQRQGLRLWVLSCQGCGWLWPWPRHRQEARVPHKDKQDARAHYQYDDRSSYCVPRVGESRERRERERGHHHTCMCEWEIAINHIFFHSFLFFLSFFLSFLISFLFFSFLLDRFLFFSSWSISFLFSSLLSFPSFLSFFLSSFLPSFFLSFFFFFFLCGLVGVRCVLKTQWSRRNERRATLSSVYASRATTRPHSSMETTAASPSLLPSPMPRTHCAAFKVNTHPTHTMFFFLKKNTISYMLL